MRSKREPNGAAMNVSSDENLAANALRDAAVSTMMLARILRRQVSVAAPF